MDLRIAKNFYVDICGKSRNRAALPRYSIVNHFLCFPIPEKMEWIFELYSISLQKSVTIHCRAL